MYFIISTTGLLFFIGLIHSDDRELLKDANLNNLVVSGRYGNQRLAKGTHFGNGWTVGPFNDGVSIFDKTNDGVQGIINDPGVNSGVRLMVLDKPGSVYIALGVLEKDQLYNVSWYDTMDRHHSNSAPDQYTVRVAINNDIVPKFEYGGWQIQYQTNTAWTHRSATIEPTENVNFFLSFKGVHESKQMGAMITMVSVIEHSK